MNNMTILKADMPGVVYKIKVTVGAEVNSMDVLVVLESMKMELPVEAPGVGRVEEIYVSEGDVVEEDQPLLRLILKG